MPTSRNIKLVLEYDGATFFGFQRQPKHPTIQSHLETALKKLFNQSIKIVAASGRTDRGVHATHQVVNFKVESTLKLDSVQKGLNRYLPKEIAVKKVQVVKDSFHARYDAKSKTYEYRVWNHAARSPLQAGSSYHMPYDLDLSKMRKAASVLKGKHDFKAFCASDPSRKGEKNTVRTISKLTISKKGSLIVIQVKADGFLYNMVRILVGTLLEIGQSRMDLTGLRRALKARDRRKSGKTVPPQGLALINVSY